MIAFVHLHGVAQGTGGAGNDGDLLHRSGMALQCCDQGMTDFVIADNQLFLVRQDGVLLLIAGNDHFDGFFQVSLVSFAAAVTHGTEGSLVDNIGQLCAGSTGGHAGNAVEIHIVGKLDLLGVYPEDFFTTLQVGELHRHTAVKTTGTGQCRIQGFGTVGCCQNDDAVVAFEAVHFCQQLIQGLLPFIVAAQVAAFTLLTDGVNFINEHDAGCLFLGLLEQVTNLAGTHAHEHFNELGTTHGEERNIGFTGHSLGQHGFAGTGRAYEQHALRHGGTDVLVLVGVMQVVDNFFQVFLCFVLAGHIGELDAVGRFHINLGVALAHAEHHGA